MTTTGSGTKRGAPAPFVTAALLMFLQFVSPTPALAAAGALDTSFDGDGKVTTDFGPGRDDANGIAIYADGRIVAAGNMDVTPQVGRGFLDFALARYLPDGRLDPSFGGDGMVTTDFGGCEFPWAVAIQSDGKVVAGGNASAADPATTNCGAGGLDFALARYNPDGTLDRSFDGDGTAITDFGEADDRSVENIFALAIQRNGKIVAAGVVSAGQANGTGSDIAVVRYRRNGALDPSFDGDGRVTTDLGGEETGFGVAVQPNNRVVVAGQSRDTFGGSDFALTRYLPSGKLDSSFGGDGEVVTDFGRIDGASDLAITLDGMFERSIVVAGSTYPEDVCCSDFALARYQPNGDLDPSFGGDGTVTTDFGGGGDFGSALAIQANGGIVAIGTTFAGDQDFALARFMSDGTLDPTFEGDGRVVTDFGGEDAAEAIAIDSSGRIVGGGRTGETVVSADRAFAIARYLAT
jgi:uncharacterized delta-60 repeat protein